MALRCRDFDIDLFAPIQSKSVLFDLLQSFNHEPVYELESIRATLLLENGVRIPFGIDFFDADLETFIDNNYSIEP